MNQKPAGKRTDQKAFDETIAPENTTDTNSGDDFVTEAMPESLGRYRIEKILGRGGMGAVYLAHDGQLDRKVALKIPRFGSNTDEKLVARFYREARSAANLSHPNLCPVFDVGEIDGTHYIAMAYIQGRTLSDFVNAEKPPPSKVTAVLIRKVAIAMEEAHQSGILHRDLKPANIMVDQRKEPVVMDFGLACPQDSGDDTRLTQDGTLLGSPAYMSPEQLRGQPDAIGKASDVYSLGVVLYELLAGHLPFHDAASTIAMISRILTEQPADISELRRDIDPTLAAICRKAMSKNVSDRYGSMAAFAEALGKYIKSSRGGTGKLAEPNAVGAADISRIQLTEQSRLAKTLCESGQFVAAVPILKQIIANPLGQEADGQDTKVVLWAKATLGQVQARIAQQAKKQQAKKQDALEDDLFANLPATTVQATPHRPAPRRRLASHDRKGAELRRWLAISGAGITAVALVAVGVIVFLSDPKDAASEPVDQEASSTVVTAVPTEPEVVEDPIVELPLDRAQPQRQSEQFSEREPGGHPPDDFGPPGPENDRLRGRRIPDDIMEWDIDQDKRISASEIPQGTQGRKFLMEQADLDGDGFIDLSEAAAFEPRRPPRGEREIGGRGPGREGFDGRGDFDGRRGRERPRPPGGPGPRN